LTSQPNLGSLVEALRHGPRDTGVDPQRLRMISSYWEQVPTQYGRSRPTSARAPPRVRARHAGGQYTNLREQARALGIDEARCRGGGGVRGRQRHVGDIVKVTPTSKAVGDMALLMVTSGISREQVLDPDTEVAFPESVVEFSAARWASPTGFPAGVAAQGAQGHPAPHPAPGCDAAAGGPQRRRARIQERLPRPVTDEDLAS